MRANLVACGWLAIWFLGAVLTGPWHAARGEPAGIAGRQDAAHGDARSSPPPHGRTLESYTVDADKLAPAVEKLKAFFAGRNDVRVTSDPANSRLFFLAAEREQYRIANWLASWAQTEVRPVQHTTNVAPGTAGQTDVAPATMLSDGGQEPAEDAEVVLEQAAEAVQHTELLRSLGYNVEIQVLPDQDVIVLRGRDVDVEAVADIIREIERVAKLAKPEVEIVPLQHVRGEAVVDLIEEVREALVQGRQGRVTARALDTPNAILLIGWGEAQSSVRGLIEKLDLPVEPDTQLKVFRLRNAGAERARSIVEDFFEGRGGLGPAAKVVADASTNTLIVHATPRDLAEVSLLVSELDVPRGDAVSQVHVFKLKHTLADDLATTLNAAIEAARGGGEARSTILELITIDGQQMQSVQSGLLDDVEITANVQTNSLVISGPAASIELVAALIERLDQPTSTSQIKVFRIVHGEANSLVLMLRALLPSTSGPTARPQLPGAAGETSLAPLRFAVEQRTNSIIATGTAGDLRIVEALLLRLDEDDTQRRRTTVYRLRNAPALDVARAVNDFLRSERQIQLVAPGEESPLEQLEREVVVVPEPVSNSIILSATRRFYDEIFELVQQLDAQPPQVVIQVLIGQVTLHNSDEFGVELGLQDSVLFDRSLLGDLITTTTTSQTSTPAGIVTSTNQIIQSATNEPGFNFNNSPLGNSASHRALTNADKVGAQGLSHFSVGRINNELGFGGLVLSASSESVSVLIRALQESRRLEILSRPQVTTLDNQPAYIQVGQRVPRIVATSLTNFGQTNSIELDNVGLILGVTPRVSPSGMVVMEIDAERSEVGPEIEGIPISVSTDGTVIRSPRIDITVAQTTVSAVNGETIVLGGLITTREMDVHRRVPLIADIPLIGDLFRYDYITNHRAELLIILTPHVVLGPADMERIKQIESARMHWCAADVHALHGDPSFCDRADCPLCEADIPVVYPDLNPRGLVSQPNAFEAIAPEEPSQFETPGPQLLPPISAPP